MSLLEFYQNFPSKNTPYKEKISQLNLIIDHEVAGVSFCMRQPYFRMRSRSVTEEQSFDIIRRTDYLFNFHMRKYNLEGLVNSGCPLSNWWYSLCSPPMAGYVQYEAF